MNRSHWKPHFHSRRETAYTAHADKNYMLTQEIKSATRPQKRE